METRFSRRLSSLMKERKISGQRIGEIVGKSQKTISRYATGEIEPSQDMKNEIYRAIATISGIKEDALTEEELDQREVFWEMSEQIKEFPDSMEIQIANQLAVEDVENTKNLINIFRMLSVDTKEYYLAHFDIFHSMEYWEVAVLDFFHELAQYRKEELIRYLENFNFDYKSLSNIGKLGGYMRMISDSQNRPLFIIDKDSVSDSLCAEEMSLIDEFHARFYESQNGYEHITIPSYPWFLSYTPYDWYFLLRVLIFELQDETKCLWSDDYEIILGAKLAFLLNSMKI